LEESGVIAPKLDRVVLTKNLVDHHVKKDILKSKPEHLECNFDRALEKLMQEVIAWKKLISFGV